MTVTTALVIPLTAFGAGSYESNLSRTWQYVRQAAASGAQLVCLPETYPGEWRAPVRRTPDRDLADIAKASDVYLLGGFAEPIDSGGDRCYNTLALFGPDGLEVGRYRRTVPAHAPWIYRGGRYWDFDWVPGNDLPVFETDIGRIGTLVCSEVYAPELPRILALKGAELLLMPAGLAGPNRHPGGYGGALFQTWRTLSWARAIENLCYTAVCSNQPAEDSQAMALAFSPEEILLEEYSEGVHLVDFDLDRIRWLRRESDRTVDGESPWRTKPGVLRDWRRKEVLAGNPILLDG